MPSFTLHKRHPALAAALAAVALIAGAAAAWKWWQAPSDPILELARGMAGERWYDLTLDDRHIGYWRTWNHRDDDGNWIFESEQRFALNPLDPVSTTTRRVFDASPPYMLLRAEYRQSRRQWSTGSRLEASGSGYTSTPDSGGPPKQLDRHYTLTDYLAFERWLAARRPAPGSVRSVTAFDFDRSAFVPKSFDVVALNDLGYRVESAAPLSATSIQLDAVYSPISVDIAGLFQMTLSTRDRVLAPRSALHTASYYIPADRRLENHTRISRLVLGIHGEPAPLFDDAIRDDEGWRLTLSANPVSGARMSEADLAATLQLPSDHPDIVALARQAVAGAASDTDRARALTGFVHDFLSYRPGLAPRGVLTLLDDPRGDCTEFADLLTSLARAIGLPGRTVFGLAYSDGAEPAFAYHAWNELHVDGDWLAVDPTWGQVQVDATHIPLPIGETAALRLLTGDVSLAFSVLQVEHFEAEG